MSKGTIRYYVRNIFAYFDSFWVLESNGIHPLILSNKNLCSVGIWRVGDVEAKGYVELDSKSKKAMQFIKLIKQYKELAPTARDAGKYLARRAVTTWENGEEDLSEWSEQKGEGFYQLANYYEKRVLKLKRLLVELIETSDEPLIVNINSKDLVALGPPFHRIL